MSTEKTLVSLIEQHRVVVCAGAGGVGKTTVAAALAIGAARRGRRVLCLTIDPAKRLLDSLGLSGMKDESGVVSPSRFRELGIPEGGSLTVSVLDTKRTFDDIVARHAPSAEVRERILGNRFYQYVSTSLAGTQSYMAMEKVLGVLHDQRFDLIVLDTPPTSEALDFFDAPERLVEALDSPAVRWLVDAFEPGKKLGLGVLARGVAFLLRGVGKLTGRGFLEHMAEFVTELNDLFGGFKERARAVSRAFRGDDFAYALVSTPVAAALDEARLFIERLDGQGIRTDALVLNRVHPPAPRSVSQADAEAAATRQGLPRSVAPLLLVALAEEGEQARSDERALVLFDAALARTKVRAPAERIVLPLLAGDVHDLGELLPLSQCLV
jgi:anion-transporting  ArsA/GET3 family ATPase